MSGEVVVVSSAAVGSALAIGGLFVVGGIALQMAKEHQRQQQMQAQKKAAEQKRQLKSWEDYQVFQQQTMQHLNAQRQMARDAFANLQLHLQKSTHQGSNNTPELGAQARSFLDSDETTQVQKRLQQVQNWLAQLPQSLQQHENSPIPRLQTQLEQFNKQSPHLETIEDFIETAKRSVTQFMKNLEKQRQQHEQVLQQAELQLNELLHYQQFAKEGVESEEVSALKAHLLVILEQTTATVSLNALSVLQKKSASLKQRINERLEQQAAEEVIYQRVHHHLQEMGYSGAQQQDERVNSWAIPGGEQVRFALQADFRLTFQVAHERSRHTDAALSLQERAFLHQQEHKWCQDLPNLLKRLQADGLNYRVDFERQLPDDRIPIVILETVDELLAAEEEEAIRLQQQQPVKRYLE